MPFIHLLSFRLLTLNAAWANNRGWNKITKMELMNGWIYGTMIIWIKNLIHEQSTKNISCDDSPHMLHEMKLAQNCLEVTQKHAISANFAARCFVAVVIHIKTFEESCSNEQLTKRNRVVQQICDNRLSQQISASLGIISGIYTIALATRKHKSIHTQKVRIRRKSRTNAPLIDFSLIAVGFCDTHALWLGVA